MAILGVGQGGPDADVDLGEGAGAEPTERRPPTHDARILNRGWERAVPTHSLLHDDTGKNPLVSPPPLGGNRWETLHVAVAKTLDRTLDGPNPWGSGGASPGGVGVRWRSVLVEEEAVKVAIAVVLVLLLGRGAVADGQKEPIIDAPLAIHLIVSKGISCLGNLGWDGLDTSDVPGESSPEIQREVGRCLGILDAAIMHSERALPPQLYEQQASLYLVTLRPSLVGYAECLAETCPDLEVRIEAVHTTMWPVERVLRDIIINDH